MTSLRSLLPSQTAVDFVRAIDRERGRETAVYWVQQFQHEEPRGVFVKGCERMLEPSTQHRASQVATVSTAVQRLF